MPDEYDAVRRDMSNYEKGLYFELGRAHERGETRERGWVKQFEIRIGQQQDRRRFDSARTDGKGVRSVERKSGRVNEREALGQLGLEREALDSGQLTHSTWETVEGEKLPAKVVGDMQKLEKDFPGRFRHEIVSRADAARAIRLGQSLMSKQLELIRAYELTRADRARKRLEKIREIVRAREAKERDEPAREKDGQQREPDKSPKSKALKRDPLDPRTRESRDDNKPPAVAREPTDPTPKTRDAREREEAQARETVNSLGSFLSDAQKEQILAARRQERNNERHAVFLKMKPTPRQEPPMPPPVPQRTPEQEREAREAREAQAREAAEKQRQQERARLEKAGLAQELIRNLELAYGGAVPPAVVERDRLGQLPRAVRGGRNERDAREREAREREGR